MKLDDIIEGLNRHIDKVRRDNNIKATGHLVIQSTLTPNLSFKAYKTYEIILWYVTKSNRFRIFTVSNCARTLSDQEEYLKRETHIELCNNLFNWIGSDDYNKVLIEKL